MLKYTIIKLNLPISYKYVFYQTHRCIYSVMTKNILNTKSGNLEMSQCLHCTSRNMTYCDKGRINTMKFFPTHFSLFGYHMKIYVLTTNTPTPTTTTKKLMSHHTPTSLPMMVTCLERHLTSTRRWSSWL